MFICNASIWIGIVVAVVGIIILFVEKSKSKNQSSPELRKVNLTRIIGLLIFFSGVIFATANQVAYGSCTRVSGRCPSTFPAGSTAYACTNEYTQCSWRGNCITKAKSWPWESDCECKCVNTTP